MKNLISKIVSSKKLRFIFSNTVIIKKKSDYYFLYAYYTSYGGFGLDFELAEYLKENYQWKETSNQQDSICEIVRYGTHENDVAFNEKHVKLNTQFKVRTNKDFIMAVLNIKKQKKQLDEKLSISDSYHRVKSQAECMTVAEIPLIPKIHIKEYDGYESITY